MIVGKNQAHAIAAGKATTVRRPVDTGEYQARVRRGRTEVRKPSVYEVGQTKAIKSSLAADPACHVLVTDVRTELLAEVTYTDARLMGFKTTAAFKSHWVRLYDPAWLQRMEPLVDKPDGTSERLVASEEDLIARFDQRHSGTEVWVLTFELENDRPHLLAERSEELYVATPGRAMTGEPEAIDVARLGSHWTDGAEQRRRDARATEELKRRRRSLANRVRNADLAAIERIEQHLNDEQEAA